MHFVIRLVVTALSLWLAVQLVPGINYLGEPIGLLGVALVFGVANAIIRPILALLTCPLVVLTLGLFVFVLNAVMLLLTARFSEALGLNFQVTNFWSALLGALIVGVASTVLNLLVGTRTS